MKPNVRSAIERIKKAFEIMEMVAPDDLAHLASYTKNIALGNQLTDVACAAGEIEDAARRPNVKLQAPMRHLSEAISRAECDSRKDSRAA